MNYQELEPIREFEPGILYREGIYFYSPSDFAKENLYYVHFGGLYTCASPYRIEREYYHTFFLARILEGEFYVCFQGNTMCAKAGSIVFLDCKQKHSYWAETPVTFQWLHFDGCSVQAYFDYLTEQQHNVCFTGKHDLFFPFDSIIEELKTDHGNEHRLSFLLHTILGLLAISDKRKEPEAVTNAVQYMAAHYQDNISVEDIAGSLALNPRYFSRLFKKYMASSPHQYLIALRLRRAKALLLETPLSIQQIAEECGFTNSTHFIRAFKQENKITPQKYRKLLLPVFPGTVDTYENVTLPLAK